MDCILSVKMKAIADADNLPINHDLRVKAQQFEDVMSIQYTEPKKFLGAWARARRAYCNYTGKGLLDDLLDD